MRLEYSDPRDSLIGPSNEVSLNAFAPNHTKSIYRDPDIGRQYHLRKSVIKQIVFSHRLTVSRNMSTRTIFWILCWSELVAMELPNIRFIFSFGIGCRCVSSFVAVYPCSVWSRGSYMLHPVSWCTFDKAILNEVWYNGELFSVCVDEYRYDV